VTRDDPLSKIKRSKVKVTRSRSVSGKIATRQRTVIPTAAINLVKITVERKHMTRILGQISQINIITWTLSYCSAVMSHVTFSICCSFRCVIQPLSSLQF